MPKQVIGGGSRSSTYVALSVFTQTMPAAIHEMPTNDELQGHRKWNAWTFPRSFIDILTVMRLLLKGDVCYADSVFLALPTHGWTRSHCSGLCEHNKNGNQMSSASDIAVNLQVANHYRIIVIPKIRRQLTPTRRRCFNSGLSMYLIPAMLLCKLIDVHQKGTGQTGLVEYCYS